MMLHAGICDSGMWGCVLVGASMGGLVALDLAIARPDLISSLVQRSVYFFFIVSEEFANGSSLRVISTAALTFFVVILPL